MGGGGAAPEINMVCPAITPATEGDNLLTNGSMEAGSPPTGWGALFSAALTSVADERTGGAGAASIGIARNGGATSAASQTITLARTNRWFQFDFWAKRVDATSISAGIIGVLYGGFAAKTVLDWTSYLHTCVQSAANPRIDLYVSASVDAQSGRFDDVSLMVLNWDSMISHLGDRAALAGSYTCTPTHVLQTQCGLLIGYKDNLNWIGMILDRSTANYTAKLIKCVAGNVSEVISGNMSAIFANGRTLRVDVSGTTFTLYYHNTQIGAPTAINDGVFGLGVYGFSTNAGNAVGTVVTAPF